MQAQVDEKMRSECRARSRRMLAISGLLGVWLTALPCTAQDAGAPLSDVSRAEAVAALEQVMQARGLVPPPESGLAAADYISTEVSQNGTRMIYLWLDEDGNLTPNFEWREANEGVCGAQGRWMRAPVSALSLKLHRYDPGDHEVTAQFIEIGTGRIEKQQMAGDSGDRLTTAIGKALAKLEAPIGDVLAPCGKQKEVAETPDPEPFSLPPASFAYRTADGLAEGRMSGVLDQFTVSPESMAAEISRLDTSGLERSGCGFKMRIVVLGEATISFQAQLSEPLREGLTIPVADSYRGEGEIGVPGRRKSSDVPGRLVVVSDLSIDHPVPESRRYERMLGRSGTVRIERIEGEQVHGTLDLEVSEPAKREDRHQPYYTEYGRDPIRVRIEGEFTGIANLDWWAPVGQLEPEDFERDPMVKAPEPGRCLEDG